MLFSGCCFFASESCWTMCMCVRFWVRFDDVTVWTGTRGSQVRTVGSEPNVVAQSVTLRRTEKAGRPWDRQCIQCFQQHPEAPSFAHTRTHATVTQPPPVPHGRLGSGPRPAELSCQRFKALYLGQMRRSRGVGGTGSCGRPMTLIAVTATALASKYLRPDGSPSFSFQKFHSIILFMGGCSSWKHNKNEGNITIGKYLFDVQARPSSVTVLNVTKGQEWGNDTNKFDKISFRCNDFTHITWFGGKQFFYFGNRVKILWVFTKNEAT